MKTRRIGKLLPVVLASLSTLLLASSAEPAEASATIHRLGDSGGQAGKIGRLSAAQANGNTVTSVADGNGNLKLISWDVAPGGTTVKRLGDSDGLAGKIGLVSSVYLGDGTLVTPVRDGSGNLKLISWGIPQAAGSLQRLGDSGTQAGAIGEVSAVLLGSGRLLTAVQDGAGNLKLITWQVSMNGTTVQRLGDSGGQAGKIGLLSVVGLADGRVVTPVRDGSGNLKLISWRVSDDGTTIQRKGDSGTQAGAISLVATAYSGFGRVVTAVRDGSGNLKLINWQISEDGVTVKRLGDSGSQAGAISRVAIVSLGDGQVVTAVRDGSGNLKLIAWQISADGVTIQRLGDSGAQAGAIGLVEASALADGTIVTAVQDGSGNLKLITWALVGAPVAVHHRRNINSFGSADLKTLRDGISTLQSRAEAWPASWLYQADIHGASAGAVEPSWNTCQHGSWYFLPWHRMYLYYLEKLLRDASGSASFALPYWDYSDPANRQIPLPYRQPADASNPLFVSQRNSTMNAGGQLPPSSVSLSAAYAETAFSSVAGSGSSFGGQRSGPGHGLSPHSVFESTPHDDVHVDVGGWMASFNTAGRDPVFWLHHCNIDRLWEGWLAQGGGRTNPTPPQGDPWLTHRFEFFDIDAGTFVSLTGAQILHTASQLDYDYDALPAVAAPKALRARPEREPKALTMMVEKEASGLRLQRKPVSFSLQLPQPEEAAKAGGLLLSLEGIELDKMPLGNYEVYVDLPGDETPSFESPYFVGNLSFFGMGPRSEAPKDARPVIQTFGLDKVVRFLQEQGRWSGEINVTFVFRGPIPPPGMAPPETEPATVTIRRIRILRQ